MNCCNHQDRNASAICTQCGKGICNECLSSKTGLCKDCYSAYLRSKVVSAAFYLVVLAVLGVIGYYWDFMGSDNLSAQGTSCYMLMAICTGIFLVFGKIQIPAMTFFSVSVVDFGIMMLLVTLFKFLLAVVLGAVLLPLIIIWQIFVIALNVSRLKKNNQNQVLSIS